MAEVQVGIKYVIENMSELQQQFGQIAEQAMQIATGPTAAGIGPSVPTPLPPHASSPTPWGPRASDDDIGMFPGARSTMPPYAGGSSAPPMGASGNVASSIVIQTVNTLTISRVENLSIAGVGAGGAGGGGAGGGGAAGAGAPAAFDPNQTIMPGDWPPGPSVPAANAGGSAPTGTRAAGGPRRMRFGMYSTPYQFNQWAYQELQDAQASGDPYRYADAFQQYQRSQQHVQNLQQQNQPPPPPPSMAQQFVRGAISVEAGREIMGQVSAGISGLHNYYLSGGDISKYNAIIGVAQQIPVIGGALGAGLEKAQQIEALQQTAAFYGKALPPGISQGTSPAEIQALMRLIPSGMGLPQSLTNDLRLGGMPYPVRGDILSAYAQTRTSPYAMAQFGVRDIEEGTKTMPRSALSQLADLAMATGDYDAARKLYASQGDTVGVGMVDTRRQEIPAAQLTQARAQRAAGLTEQVRGMTLSAGFRSTTQRAVTQYTYFLQDVQDIPRKLALEEQMRLGQEEVDRATAAGNRRGAIAAADRIQGLRGEWNSIAAASIERGHQEAQLPLTVPTQAGLSRAAFTIDVLQNIPGAYGNIRGAYLSQIGLLENAVNEVQSERKMQEAKGPLKPADQLIYQERMQDLMRQQASAFQAASYGWEGRLIQQAINAPGNFNMVVSRFSLMDAVTRAGVRNPHMGATQGQLPAFMRFAGILNWPALPFGGQTGGPMGVPGIPGMGGDAGAAMPQGGPPDFFPSGVTGGAGPTPGPVPGAAGGLPPGPAQINESAPGPGGISSAPPAGGGAGSPHHPAAYSHDPAVRSSPSGTAGRRRHPAAGPPHHRADKMQPGETYEDYVRRRNAELGIPTFAAGPETVYHQGAPGKQWLGGAPEAGDTATYGTGYYQQGLHPPAADVVHPAPPGGGGRGAHGTGPAPGAAGGAGAAGGLPPVNITVNISLDGKQVASKTISGASGAASAVQNGLAQGGADDMIAQMGYSQARQT
jgi:hypothetical protein